MNSNARELAGYASSLPNFRNLLINGGVTISQRGDVNAISMSGNGVAYTAADRWCIRRANVSSNGTVNTTVTGGVLRVTEASANTASFTSTSTAITQIIEAQNCYHLAGKQVTFSFKFKTSKIGNYGVFLYGYDSSSYSTPQTIEVLDTNTNSYSFTFTMPTGINNDNGEGVGVNITIAADSDRAGTWYNSTDGQINFFSNDGVTESCELSEAQLEEGTVATPFEHRPIGVELSLAKRYFEKSEKSYRVDRAISSSSTYGISFFYEVEKRATPLVITTAQGGTTGQARANGTAYNVTQDTGAATSRFFTLYFNGVLSVTSQNAVTTDCSWSADAEL